MVKFVSLVFALGASAGLAYVFYEIAQWEPILAWFGGVNIILFLLMGKDKLAAKTGVGRTPERTLLTLGVLGGFPSMFAARKLFNHKTTKRKFVLAMWALFALQLAALAYLYATPEMLGLQPKANAVQTR